MYPGTSCTPLVIPSTFNAHHHPDLPDYGNQFHQIVAAIRYLHSRYGIDVTRYLDAPRTLANTIALDTREGTVTIDGHTLPWFIRDDGADIEGTGANEFPCVTLSIPCENIYLDNQPTAHLRPHTEHQSQR